MLTKNFLFQVTLKTTVHVCNVGMSETILIKAHWHPCQCSKCKDNNVENLGQSCLLELSQDVCHDQLSVVCPWQ